MNRIKFCWIKYYIVDRIFSLNRSKEIWSEKKMHSSHPYWLHTLHLKERCSKINEHEMKCHLSGVVQNLFWAFFLPYGKIKTSDDRSSQLQETGCKVEMKQKVLIILEELAMYVCQHASPKRTWPTNSRHVEILMFIIFAESFKLMKSAHAHTLEHIFFQIRT